MTFGEYCRALGFGALFTASRTAIDRLIEQKGAALFGLERSEERNRNLQERLDLAMTALEQERQARIELHEKLTDSLMTKAGLQKLNFRPGPPKESKPQALTALDEMELDYDRVQAEDRELSQ